MMTQSNKYISLRKKNDYSKYMISVTIMMTQSPESEMTPLNIISMNMMIYISEQYVVS